MIMLGKGNDEAALEALHAWPSEFLGECFLGSLMRDIQRLESLQIGGGIDPSNARYWLDTGLAEKVSPRI